MKEIFRWISDEAILQSLVQGLPAIVLIIVIGVCVVMLSKGADWMIDGVVHLASQTGLPRIVIGATIISLGTTLPEAFVSVMAAWLGNPGLALGNGVGSIIANAGLIFGLTCLLSRVPVNRYILNRTGWIQSGAATLLVFISLFAWAYMEGQPVLNRWVGVLFLILLGGFLCITYVWANQEANMTVEVEAPDDLALVSLRKSWLMIAGGLFLVVVGARILVSSAVEISHRMGVPEDVIAATMVALGTSLPELVTAISAVRKGRPEIMVGNVLGADVLNCLFVIGASAVARPLAVPPNFYTYHFPAMILILYPFQIFILINKEGWFKRWQGAWLFGVYLIYLVLQYALNLGEKPA